MNEKHSLPLVSYGVRMNKKNMELACQWMSTDASLKESKMFEMMKKRRRQKPIEFYPSTISRTKKKIRRVIASMRRVHKGVD